MLLYIIRHAWAGQHGDPQWPDDAQRPLAPEGTKRFARVVKKLARRGFAPQVIATSPLVRCRQTAELVAAGVEGHPEVVDREELAPGSNLEGLLRWTAGQSGCQAVAWVGHAPDVGNLVAALLGISGGGVDFAKGAVAALQFDGLPAAGTAELCWLVNAQLLNVKW